MVAVAVERGLFVNEHRAEKLARATGVSASLLIKRSGGWTKVHEEGRCRMCEREESVRPLTRHHLIPQEWFRLADGHRALRLLRTCECNIVPLCRPCHDLVEIDKGARRDLRASLGQNEIAFVIQVIGREWLDNRYPPRYGRGDRSDAQLPLQ